MNPIHLFVLTLLVLLIVVTLYQRVRRNDDSLAGLSDALQRKLAAAEKQRLLLDMLAEHRDGCQCGQCHIVRAALQQEQRRAVR